MIDEYQIGFISKGEGYFYRAPDKKEKIEAGTVFLIRPNVWHSYHPSKKTGWNEHWLLFNNSMLSTLIDELFPADKSPIFRIGMDSGLLDSYNQMHQIANNLPYSYNALLSTLAQHIATQVFSIANQKHHHNRLVDQVIEEAIFKMNESVSEPYQEKRILEGSGVSATYFRREFKKITGSPPIKYHNSLRMERVKYLLRNSNLSIKDISAQLKFDTPFHLSASFKKFTGKSPRQWRQQLASH